MIDNVLSFFSVYKITSETNTNSRTIDVHVDVEQLFGATTAKMDRIWVDLVRKESLHCCI